MKKSDYGTLMLKDKQSNLILLYYQTFDCKISAVKGIKNFIVPYNIKQIYQKPRYIPSWLNGYGLM